MVSLVYTTGVTPIPNDSELKSDFLSTLLAFKLLLYFYDIFTLNFPKIVSFEPNFSIYSESCFLSKKVSFVPENIF